MPVEEKFRVVETKAERGVEVRHGRVRRGENRSGHGDTLGREGPEGASKKLDGRDSRVSGSRGREAQVDVTGSDLGVKERGAATDRAQDENAAGRGGTGQGPLHPASVSPVSQDAREAGIGVVTPERKSGLCDLGNARVVAGFRGTGSEPGWGKGLRPQAWQRSPELRLDEPEPVRLEECGNVERIPGDPTSDELNVVFARPAVEGGSHLLAILRALEFSWPIVRNTESKSLFVPGNRRDLAKMRSALAQGAEFHLEARSRDGVHNPCQRSGPGGIDSAIA